MHLFLDIFVCFYITGALTMSVVLCRECPELTGFGNVSRSLGWPVTIYEIIS